MESRESSSQDSQLDDAAQPASKKRKLDHLNTSVNGSSFFLPSFRVSQVPPRARAKPQRPRYPHLHSEPPSLSPSPNTTSATPAAAASSSDSQARIATCVAYKTITPDDHEHAVDTKLSLLLQQVQDVKAETERCRAETDQRRIERERELERSFERRRVQREREFEIAVVQREEELERSFAQREQELRREFDLKAARVEDELGSLKKDLLTQGARLGRIVVELNEGRKLSEDLCVALERLSAVRGGLEERLTGTTEKLREADQELADIRKYRDALLAALSRVVVNEREENQVLHEYLQGSDALASEHIADDTAHPGAAGDDDDDIVSTTSSSSAHRDVASSDSDDDGESRFTRNPLRPLVWHRSRFAITFPRPYDLPLTLAAARGEHAATVQILRTRHESAQENARELQARVDRQSVDHDEAVQAVKKELTQTQASLARSKRSRAKLQKALDNALKEKIKLENLVEAQMGFEQEAKRNEQRCAELGVRLMVERKDAAKAQDKLASELEGARNKLSVAQEALTSAKDRRNNHALRLAAARGEVEEVRAELEKLKAAVGPRQRRPEAARGLVPISRTVAQMQAAEADVQVGHLDPTVAKLQRECEVRRSATKHFRSRALQAEAALVGFHLGVGIVSSTLREMLKDLKWPKKVKVEDDDDNTDTHDLWDVADACKRMLDKHGKVVEAFPDKEDYYGDLGCPLCPPEIE